MSVDTASVADRRPAVATRRTSGPQRIDRLGAARATLSPGQRRLWFLDQWAPGTAVYNIPIVTRLAGAVDAAALERALTGLVARHEVLRTRFSADRGEPVQMIEPPAAVALQQADVRGAADPDRGAREWTLAEIARPFQLDRLPLIRVSLLTVADDDAILVIVAHHIVIDGWSIAILRRELSALYEAERSRTAADLPPLPVQYADYAEWQRAWQQSPAAMRQLAYWKRQLAGLTTLTMPTSRPRPAEETFDGASLPFELGPELSDRLRRVGRDEGTTLAMTLLAGLYVLLARYTGQQDIAVGSPVANRNRTEIEDLIGFFVNTIVLRVDLTGDPTVGQLLARVREMCLDAYAHQELPFERLVEELQPAREPGRSPLVQVVFAFQPELRLSLGQAPSRPVMVPARVARFELELHVTDGMGGIRGVLAYNTNLFDRTFIETLLRHYTRALAAIAGDAETAVSDIDVADPAERDAWLAAWRGAVLPTPGDTVVQRIEAQARRTPAATAVSAGDERLTYRMLDQRADRLARVLGERGVGPEVHVGVALARSSDALVAILAVLKAGGAYVPLDTSYPPARLATMIASAAPPLVITTTAEAEVLPPDTPLLVLDAPDTVAALAASGAAPWTAPPMTAAHAAYVMFTSGSTGTPKGVVVEHGALAAFLTAMAEVASFEADDRHLAVTTPSFDISIVELLLPLCHGAEVVIASAGAVHDVAALAALIEQHRPTTLQATPGYLAVLARRRAAVLRDLTIFSGGEPLSPETATLLLGAGRALWNLYGPTEATVWATAQRVDRSVIAAANAGAVAIGAALANYEVYVLDQRLRPVPPTVIGEVYIAGPGLARGYLDHGALTATRFVANPHGARGTRMYRTGDLGRWVDGRIEFAGRADHQIKIRGHRVELGEIEAALRTHESVEDAVVVARRSGEDTRLVGYVVPRRTPEQQADADIAQVEEWRRLYDATYQKVTTAPPDFNTVDWVSSYSGEPIPAEEMRLWVEETVSRVRALGHDRVLEMGCGTGLLLTRLAPGCVRYAGVDFSPTAIAHLEAYRTTCPDLAHVELYRGVAHDMSRFADASVDAVVLNSVIQYFPSADYLADVLAEAVRVTRDGGHIFVGDVRNLRLLGAFHASVQLHKADDGLTLTELRQRVRDAQRHEPELVVDPTLFDELVQGSPRLGRVERLPKLADYDNEVSRFRYDVILHVGDKARGAAANATIDWDADGAWVHRAGEILGREPDASVRIGGIRDVRVTASVAASQSLEHGSALTAGELRQATRGATGACLADVARLAAGLARAWAWDGFEADGSYSLTLNPRVRPITVVSGPPSLAGYCTVPARGLDQRQLTRTLQRHLRETLPEHMVPGVIVPLDAWPRSAAGKLDRQALPAPHDAPGTTAAVAGTRPLTPTEGVIAAIWADILGIDQVGPDADFFQLGGHSLLILEVLDRVRAAFGVELSVRRFFDAPTVARLARAVEEAAAHGITTAPITPVPRDLPLPVSLNQEGWLLKELLGRVHGVTAPPFHVRCALRFNGPLQIEAVRQAVGELVRRHEPLRTRIVGMRAAGVCRPLFPIIKRLFALPFVQAQIRRAGRGRRATSSAFHQIVADAAALPLRIVDLTAVGSRAAAEFTWQRLAAEDGDRPFDTARAPLARAVLFRLAPDAHVLVVVLHHLIADLKSMDVLRDDLVESCRQFGAGEPGALPELEIQPADHAWWERQVLQGETLARHLDFWRGQIVGTHHATARDVPFLQRANVRSYRAGAERHDIDADAWRAVRRLAAERGVTVFMLLYASLGVLFGRYTRTARVGFASNFVNRRAETARTLGWYTHGHFVCVDLTGGPTFVELLDRVRDAMLSAHAHQELQSGLLWAAFGDDARSQGPPPNAFDWDHVLVEHRVLLEGRQAGDRLRVEPQMLRGRHTTAGVYCCLHEGADRGVLEIQYPADMFAAGDVQHLLHDWHALLTDLAARPQTRIEPVPARSGAAAAAAG